MSAATEVTDATFTTKVLESSKVTLVDFWAPWCGPCLMMAPFIDQLAAKYAESPDVAIVKLDVDENPVTSEQYRVLSIPTFAVFVDGKPVVGTGGVTTLEKLEELLAKGIQAKSLPAAA
jgi:thioredoxin 1